MATFSSAPFNSVWGYTVGIPPIPVIDSNGNVTANVINAGTISSQYGNFTNLSANNLTVTGTLTLPPNAVISGTITGNIKAPGADTEILFNIGGNLAADPDFTWNPVTNFLHVMGNACFDGGVTAGFFLGDGANITNVYAVSATTISSSSQPNITTVGNLTGLTVLGNSNLGNASNLRLGGGNVGDVLTSNGNGGVYWNNSGGGVESIANGTSNITIPTQNGPLFISASGTPNVFAVYGVNTYISSNWSMNPVVVANSEMWVDGNVRANHFDGDGSRLSNINAANLIGLAPTILANKVADSSQPNIQSLGNLVGLTVNGISNLGPVGNVVITGGNSGDVLTTDGNGVLSWLESPPASNLIEGNSNVIVYPNANIAISSNGVANVFVVSHLGTVTTGSSTVTGNIGTSSHLSVSGNATVGSNLTVSGVSNLGAVGNVNISGGSNGQFLTTNGSGNLSWTTVPIASMISNGASGVSIPLADGNIVMTANGVNSLIVTPNGVVVDSITANTLNVANINIGTTNGNFGGYFVGNVYDSGNAPYPGFKLGYRDVPQVILGSDVDMPTSMAGKHYSVLGGTTVDYTITIQPNNVSNHQFFLGAEIQIVNRGLANIHINRGTFAVELYKAGNNVSDDRTITSYGMATLLKVDTDTWFIQGTGVV